MSEDFDFGFSAVSEEELKALEKQLQQQVTAKDSELAEVSATYEQKLKALYKMIMPLLKNLSKDGDTKEYIYWPDRQKKIKEFLTKVEALVND